MQVRHCLTALRCLSLPFTALHCPFTALHCPSPCLCRARPRWFGFGGGECTRSPCTATRPGGVRALLLETLTPPGPRTAQHAPPAITQLDDPCQSGHSTTQRPPPGPPASSLFGCAARPTLTILPPTNAILPPTNTFFAAAPTQSPPTDQRHFTPNAAGGECRASEATEDPTVTREKLPFPCAVRCRSAKD